ncbi:coniferyl aldehyde dehydrogenase [Stenotrophomonas rhizophila]|uniref:coniferyl aldehyde dehydrogenase n=1 Tax=Stenotrophomonas rhizophila TaxID=216778 RepID=UPI001E335E96|nr:coniferyl aldehyde dehydrogenase [Stenotrophomonas rhizophila]MCC7635454.1 coniferyl aldehyde dehydrogenase [Stenotrophomonas rhizophila]MCC7664652.1 coniferyl aldehyde dehydrogenase [Stenotrophomonas rhizophila]
MSDAPTDPLALPAILHALRAAWQANRPSLAQRDDDLLRLRMAFKARLPQMAEAIAADFGHRSTRESLIADGMTVLGEIDHLRAHLRRWARPRRVGVGWRFWPARAQLRPVPLGVVGVIAPWNYPVNLALIPLATAIAAGNHVILKPSEHTPRTSAFLQALLAEVFPPARVAVVQGDAALASALASAPLDHLVFTGSTAVGRKVMAAAAAHLTPLTLELGGKSPAIVCSDYPLDRAAARLATGKWFNAGQTCIAPDYVLIDGARQRELVQQLQTQVRARYGDFSDAADYTRIIHEGQYRRLRGYLDQARARGVPVIELATVDPERAARERLMVPTIVLDPPADLDLMQEEIFGPILPVCAYPDLDAALAGVEARDRPLALYVFSQQREVVERVLGRIVAGGVTVNDTLLHFAINGLPFGGVGPSGMGAYHGRAGFDGLSKRLPVLWQSRWAASDLLKPPYSKIAGMLKVLLR